MEILATREEDWRRLKQVRLAALLDTPTAFGTSYTAAAAYTETQWRARAASRAGPEFWLALEGDNPVGMIGGGKDAANRFNLIGLWVKPSLRGSGAAVRLVETVKARAIEKGYTHVFLEVSPTNTRAVNFYLRQGFVFMEEWSPLDSHPHITIQTMVWQTNQ